MFKNALFLRSLKEYKYGDHQVQEKSTEGQSEGRSKTSDAEESEFSTSDQER
jgi:hypothetical protein